MAFSEDWTGSNGAAWDTAKWNAETGSGTRTIQSNKGRIVTTGGTDYDGVKSEVKSGTGVPADFDATLDISWTSLAGTAAAQFIWTFRSNLFGELFFLHMRQSGGVWYWDLYSQTGYANTSRASGTTTPPANSGDTWRFRLYCYGSLIKVKWWNIAVTAEPHLWQAEITESNAATYTEMSLEIGQHENSTSMTFDFDNLVVVASAALPTVPLGAVASEVGTSLGTNNAQTLPTGSTTGDLILGFAINDTTGTGFSVSTGWTMLDSSAASGVHYAGVFARILDGSGNDTLSASGSSNDYVIQLVRVPAANHAVTAVATDIKISSAATAGSGNANPPSLNAGSSKDWIWFAYGAADSNNVSTMTAVPSGYSMLGNLERSIATGTSSVMAALAFKVVAASTTEDPGTFSNTSQEWTAYTVAVPPYSAATKSPPISPTRFPRQLMRRAA